MIKLHHGDCLETLPAIPNGLVDMVLCDPPPYGIDFQSARRPKTERFDKILNDKTPFTAFIHPAVKPPLLRGGFKAVHSGVACSSIYWRNTSILAPPQLPAK